MNIGNKKCCIVLITHKELYIGEEQVSFDKCLETFKKRDIFIVIPNNINSDYFKRYSQSHNNFNIITMDPEWFKSYRTYQRLCCSKDFYEHFKDYEYMLVYQTDCWVFEDKLDEFIKLRHDWYGAPWPHLGDNVGNGGFCLRKVSKMLEITDKYTNIHAENEDTWFCLGHKNEMNICSLETACNFSMECITKRYLNLIKTIPMGFHGHDMKRFWDVDGQKFINFKNQHLN